MTREKSHQAIISARRQLVARLRLRGLTLQEIVTALGTGDEPLLDPRTGKPFTLSTIHRDMQAIEGEWRQATQADIGAMKARQLAELAEVKRAAWERKEFDKVLQAIKQEVDLTGTKAAAPLVTMTNINPSGVVIYLPDNGRDPDNGNN